MSFLSSQTKKKKTVIFVLNNDMAFIEVLVFTDVRDKVKCFACNLEVEQWEPHDDVFVEHCRFSPKCSFMKLKKGNEFIMVRKLYCIYQLPSVTFFSSRLDLIKVKRDIYIYIYIHIWNRIWTSAASMCLCVCVYIYIYIFIYLPKEIWYPQVQLIYIYIKKMWECVCICINLKEIEYLHIFDFFFDQWVAMIAQPVYPQKTDVLNVSVNVRFQ